MKKEKLEKIDWQRIGKLFEWFNDYKNPELREQFKDNLREFSKDKRFLKKIGVRYLGEGDIKDITNYLARTESRRNFVKGAAAAAILAAAGITKDHDQPIKKDKPYQSNYNGRLPVKGVNYDVGRRPSPISDTRPELDRSIMERELNVIKNSLKCNAVRIYGEDINRLVECSNEGVQAKYILDLLNIYAAGGMYAAFVYTFVEPGYTHDDKNPKHDLDMASFNIIKVYPKEHPKSYWDGHIIPKKSFEAIAEFYASH
ncbi:twin-arginine translocation signal domain-containing protein [Candidatus Woesearchaeota archaeon]|nr:twin-arginine translocation signal domain-containing protein [Candidatus Woesearchaeota archaeon]